MILGVQGFTKQSFLHALRDARTYLPILIGLAAFRWMVNPDPLNQKRPRTGGLFQLAYRRCTVSVGRTASVPQYSVPFCKLVQLLEMAALSR